MSGFDDPDAILGTASKLLEAQGHDIAVSVLRLAQAAFEQTGYDNWDGGTDIYTLFLRIAPEWYAQIESGRELIEQQIDTALKPVIGEHSANWVNVKIAPLVRKDPEWRTTAGSVSRATRMKIVDLIRVAGVSWNGALDEVEFLGRLFDLSAMRSNDGRFKDAAGDIWQHRVNNPYDWPDDWIFSDGRFNLLDGPRDIFLKFLAEMVHPAVRPNRDEAVKLVREFNERLRADGWQLVEEEWIVGKPSYVARQVRGSAARAASRAKSVADALDAAWMHKEISRIEAAIERDPSLAVGTAKELVETCCKTILGKLAVDIPKGTDLPKLVKMLAKELKLVPDAISEKAKGAESIKVILSNLSTLTERLAELRGLYGSGHGRDGKYRGLEPRHARLAVGAAVTFVDFVTETYHQRILATEAKRQPQRPLNS
ncbi:MAG TPA: abortive infection family protein [Methylocella sp.]|nr:abortive infection family protein [Methylocella sp.]